MNIKPASHYLSAIILGFVSVLLISCQTKLEKAQIVDRCIAIFTNEETRNELLKSNIPILDFRKEKANSEYSSLNSTRIQITNQDEALNTEEIAKAAQVYSVIYIISIYARNSEAFSFYKHERTYDVIQVNINNTSGNYLIYIANMNIIKIEML
jgi:hypothetical protein